MQNEPKAASGLLHKALVTTSGAVGGSFGLAALPIELPISTIIMLRSIGDIARSEGEDLTTPETALSCLQVFALGGLKGKGMRRKAGTLRSAACSLNRLPRLHASSSTAACSPKARQSWPAYRADRIPLRRSCHAEARSASRASDWRIRRCSGELRFH